MGCKEHSDIETYGVAGQRGCVECSSTKSLDTPTIDEILANICDQICSPDKLCEYCCEAKQALLQWHKDKARSYVPEKKHGYICGSKGGENDICTCQHQDENKIIDQTLKAIEESK